MASSDRFTELDTLLDRWRREVYGNSGADPIPILDNIATLLEKETEAYLKLPIDPFDDRHPSRAYPECALGSMLKTLFKNENFMSELTNSYLTSRSNVPLTTVSCRLLLDVLPGLDSSVVFMDSDSLVEYLLDWAESGEFPLHAYATALLGAVMEVPGISAMHREQNNHLVPIMFNRLHQLTHGSDDGPSTVDQSTDSIDPKDLVDINQPNRKQTSKSKQVGNDSAPNGYAKRSHDQVDSSDESEPTKMVKRGSQVNLMRSPIHNECSSSSWAEAYMSGSYQMSPPNTVMHQRFILQYLASLGEFQELLVHIFEYKAISYILQFIDGRRNQDVRLAFDALKFCASFLTHKKFALEFLDHGGLPHLLRVSRHGMASPGVSLCLYTLAYNEDVMERICWMKTETVEKMVSYGLWLLECSHDSSRAHSALFFSSCFQFPILLDLFDRDNGLRKLMNVISMRGLFCDDPSINELTDDEMYARRQTAKQVTLALKKYTRGHFIRETRNRTKTSSSNNEHECRPIIISEESFTDAIEQHRQQRLPFNWSALDKIIDEDLYLLKLIAHFWNEGFLFTEKTEVVRNALEVLVVCSLSVKVQRLLLRKCIRTNSPYVIDYPTIAVIVACADPKIDDADCKKSALNILINLVHANISPRAPHLNMSLDLQDPNRSGPSAKKKNASRDFPAQLRKAIWDNNGTLVLPQLLSVSSPLTEADKIRALACRVLCGLAKEESIRQIMSKLPLFTDGHLQSYMKEPILPEKRLEHASFCKYCRELIELVTGTPVSSESGIEPSFAEIRRRLVVNKTKITYDEAEANYIIYNHLLAKGYPKIAADFYKAANLSNEVITNPMLRPRSPPSQEPNSITATPSAPVTPSNKRHAINPNSPGPVIFRQNSRTPQNSNCNSANRKSLMMQKSAFQSSHLFKKLSEPSNAPVITLDTIFTDYLRNQHSQCKNPVAICPPFKLLEPHSCPEPTNRLSAPLNIVSRMIRRKSHPPRGGINGAKFDRHFIYSKFRPLRLVKDPMDIRTSSTCCAFSTSGTFLFVGTDNGIMKAFNVGSGLLEASYECHINEVGSIQASKEDNLILTTAPMAPQPQCMLWTFTDVFERRARFDNDLHAEFGKATSERIITTQELYARLWDTETGSLLHKFDAYSRYHCNRATMNYSDTLVLNDGVLWDVRVPQIVHKFPKFNDRINGIFHPNGNEIICNAHIWDIRNFRSLRTVQAFDMCQLKFNNGGDVIFSNLWDDQSSPDMSAASKSNFEFKTSFRTFDSHDYSTIATIDLKRTISNLATSSNDQYIALIESSEKTRPYHEEYTGESNVCRLYEIGRPKFDPNIDYGDDEDSAEEEDNDDDDDDDDEDDDDDDDEDDDDDPFAELGVYESDESVGGGDAGGSSEDDDTSDSHLSSSVATHSILSHDEIVPFSFHPSDVEEEEEEEQLEASTGYEDMDEEDDDDHHPYAR